MNSVDFSSFRGIECIRKVREQPKTTNQSFSCINWCWIQFIFRCCSWERHPFYMLFAISHRLYPDNCLLVSKYDVELWTQCKLWCSVIFQSHSCMGVNCVWSIFLLLHIIIIIEWGLVVNFFFFWRYYNHLFY